MKVTKIPGMVPNALLRRAILDASAARETLQIGEYDLHETERVSLENILAWSRKFCTARSLPYRCYIDGNLVTVEPKPVKTRVFTDFSQIDALEIGNRVVYPAGSVNPLSVRNAVARRNETKPVKLIATQQPEGLVVIRLPYTESERAQFPDVPVPRRTKVGASHDYVTPLGKGEDILVPFAPDDHVGRHKFKQRCYHVARMVGYKIHLRLEPEGVRIFRTDGMDYRAKEEAERRVKRADKYGLYEALSQGRTAVFEAPTSNMVGRIRTYARNLAAQQNWGVVRCKIVGEDLHVFLESAA